MAENIPPTIKMNRDTSRKRQKKFTKDSNMAAANEKGENKWGRSCDDNPRLRLNVCFSYTLAGPGGHPRTAFSPTWEALVAQ